jgi:glycosyl transferase family 25
MKIFIISLTTAKERRENIKLQLNKLSFPYEIIDAIDGRKLNKEDMERLCDMETVKKYPNWLTPSAIGCALSHYQVYKKIIEQKLDYALILEDDAELLSSFESVIKTIENKKLLDENTVTLLFSQGRWNSPVFSRIDEKVIGDGYTINYPIEIEGHMGTAIAYIISYKIAKKFEQIILPIRVGADIWHYFYQEKVFESINCVLPYIVEPYGFESTIGYHRDSLKEKIRFLLKRITPTLYASIVRNNTKQYLKNVSMYKKTDKEHFFIKNQ